MILVCEEEEKAAIQAYVQGHTPVLREDWFASPIWTSVARVLVSKGLPSGKPQLAGWLANVGLGEYAAECYVEVPFDRDVLKSLQNRAARRLLSVVADQIKVGALDPATPVEEIMAGAFTPVTDLYPVEAATGHLMDWATAYVEGKERFGYVTRWPLLDSIIGPLVKDRLFVLLGKPATGKSIWALSLALDVARQGGHVVFNSLDMGRERTFLRLISAITGIPFSSLWHKRMSPAEMGVFREAEAMLRALPLEIVSIRSVEELERLDADLKIVDFLQLCTRSAVSESWIKSMSEQVTATMDNLKRQSRDSFVLAVSQLRRGDDGGFEGGIWSSSIEQNADVWAALVPHKKHRRIVTLDIRKHRDGPTGQIPYFIYYEVDVAIELPQMKELNFVVGGGGEQNSE